MCSVVEGPGGPVARALALISAGLDQLADADPWQLPDPDLTGSPRTRPTRSPAASCAGRERSRLPASTVDELSLP